MEIKFNNYNKYSINNNNLRNFLIVIITIIKIRVWIKVI